MSSKKRRNHIDRVTSGRTLSGVLVLLVALMVLTGCSGDAKFAGGSGMIEADEALVSAETSGRVMTMFFQEGDSVSVGDTLLVIDPSRIELQLSAMRSGREVIAANLKAARVQVGMTERTEQFAGHEHDRVSRLLQSGTANQQQLDKASYEHDQAVIATQAAKAQVVTLQAQMTQTDAEISLLERQLTDCYPTAPTAGVITDKNIDAGELLNPGKAVAKIARLDTVWVKVYLPSGDFTQVRLGDKATVSTESGGREFEGAVIWTAEEAEFTPKNVQTKESRADLVYAVKVQVANPDRFLKIGMPVFVTMEQK